MKISLKQVIIGVVGLAVVGGGAAWYAVSHQPTNYKTVKVTRGTVVQEVLVTGKTKPVSSVDLAFEKGGTVKTVKVDVGSVVKAGDLMVELDSQELQAQLAQAHAGVASATAQKQQLIAGLAAQMAKLDEVKKGARPEQVQVSKDSVSSAQSALDSANTALASANEVAASELAKDQASLDDAQTNLNDVNDKARLDLANLYGGVIDVLHTASNDATSAVNQTDDLYIDNNDGSAPKLSFYTSDSQVESNAEAARTNAKNALAKIQSIINVLSNDQPTIDVALVSVKAQVQIVKDYLTTLNTAVDGSNLSSSTTATYKSDISIAQSDATSALSAVNARQQAISSQRQNNQSAINAAMTQYSNAKSALALQVATNNNSIASAKSRVNDAQSALASAKSQLALTQAGSTSQAIAAQQAAVDQARSNVLAQSAQIESAQSNEQFYESQVAKTKLIAPIDGVVTKQDAKVGQIVGGNVNLVSIISDKKFEIEAEVPEADIQRVALGQDVAITFDALPNQNFMGKVAYIDPAETVIDGVVNFRVRIALQDSDGGVRSGMTANLSIRAATKENVLVVPQVAVIENDKGTFVRVKLGDSTQDQPITVGLRGENGVVEVLTGVTEGEDVIDVSVKQN